MCQKLSGERGPREIKTKDIEIKKVYVENDGVGPLIIEQPHVRPLTEAVPRAMLEQYYLHFFKSFYLYIYMHKNYTFIYIFLKNLDVVVIL